MSGSARKGLVTTSQRTKRRDFVLRVIASFERFGVREDECFCQQIDPGATVDWETQWMTRAEQASGNAVYFG